MNETGEYGESGTGRTLGEEVKAGAREAVEVGKERTRSFLAEQKEVAAAQVGDLASMLRSAARERGGESGASVRLAERAADGMERLAAALQERDLRGLLSGCEDFARRSPAVFVGGALTAGFLLTRFLKSSRERRDREERPEPNFGQGVEDFAERYSVQSEPVQPFNPSSPAGRAY